jgi:hypothetical protein
MVGAHEGQGRQSLPGPHERLHIHTHGGALGVVEVAAAVDIPRGHQRSAGDVVFVARDLAVAVGVETGALFFMGGPTGLAGGVPLGQNTHLALNRAVLADVSSSCLNALLSFPWLFRLREPRRRPFLRLQQRLWARARPLPVQVTAFQSLLESFTHSRSRSPRVALHVFRRRLEAQQALALWSLFLCSPVRSYG